ncbi:MAG: histidine phosphatase family protein [Gammaproteobacteria bacterium]|nr:histidine phosphatase family protein [Gammaproteobacteria bacterium]
MKQLFLIRHGRAFAEEPGQLDLHRTLTEEGEQQVKEVVEQLCEHHIKPDLILCSPATRAMQTASLLAVGLGVLKEKIKSNSYLYEESLGQLIEIVRAIPNHCSTVFVVAHNPTLSWFATYLNNNQAIDLSTCGVFAVQFDVDSWDAITNTEVKGRVLLD